MAFPGRLLAAAASPHSASYPAGLAEPAAPIPPGSNYVVNGEWSGNGTVIQYRTANGGSTTQLSGVTSQAPISQSLTGDGSIVARVTAQADTDPWAKSGIMIKQSTTAGSAYALLAVNPGNGVTFQHGFNASAGGGGYTFPNAWLKLTRAGSVITAYTSADGTTWTQVGTTTIAMTDPVTIGLFVTSHNAGSLNASTFDNVSVTSGGSNLPVPWSDSDIGNPAPAGSASYAGGVFTVNGGGNDIWGTLDQFNYVSQSLTGDGSIVARVTAQADTDPWAKSGIMIKQSTTAGSAYALLAVTPGNGVTFQHGYNASAGGGGYTFPSAWLKLTRAGSVITAYTAADGTTWTQVGTTTIAMTDPVTIGLFVTSHNAGSLNASTFDNVSVTSGGSNLPVPWSDSDIG